MLSASLVGKVFFVKPKETEYGNIVTLGIHCGNNAGIFIDVASPTEDTAKIAKGSFVYIGDFSISAKASGERPLTNYFKTYAKHVKILNIADMRMSSNFSVCGTYSGDDKGKHVISFEGRVNPKTKEVSIHRVLVEGDVPVPCRVQGTQLFLSGFVKGIKDDKVPVLEADRIAAIGG